MTGNWNMLITQFKNSQVWYVLGTFVRTPKDFEEFGEETSDFFRLFLVPGMDHCTAFSNLGITEDSLDPLTALEKWVEKDSLPNELPVTRFEQDGTVNSRLALPLYLAGNR